MKALIKQELYYFCKGYNEYGKDIYNSIAFLYLDECPGEFDVETGIGAVSIQGFDNEVKDSAAIEDLAVEFDKIKYER